MKKFLLLLISIAVCCTLHAQQTKIDSLQAVISKHVSDTTGVETLIALAGEYYLSEPSKAENYCWKANQVSQSIHFEKGKSASYGWLAFLFEQRGAIDSALLFYSRALEIDKKLGNKKQQGQLLNNIAAIYKDQGKVDTALVYYAKSIALHKAAKDEEGMSSTINNIGLIYQNRGQMNLALDYYGQALHIEDSVKNKDGIATSLYNIASVYKDLAQYDEALDYLQRSLKIEIEINDKYNQSYSINYIGTIYEEQGLNQKALEQYRKSLIIRQSIDDQQGIAYSLRNIGGIYEKLDSISTAMDFYSRSLVLLRAQENAWGECRLLYKIGNLFFRRNQLDSAMTYGTQSLLLAKKLGYPADISKAAELLEKIYRQQGKWELAVNMYDLVTQMKDSVQNDQTRKAAIKSQFKYEYEKKEAELKAAQEKQNLINAGKIEREKLLRNFFIAGIVLLLLIILLLYNRYKIKSNTSIALEKKNKIISEERDRSDNLLLNILPSEVAAELKEHGSAKARSFNNVTVMFTDFKDFTLRGEQLSPEQLVNEINYCFSAFDKIIGKYPVEKIKTIGDAYMCVCGLPVNREDHAEIMLKTALEIRDFMAEYKREREAADLLPFQMRIGLNSGPVVAGVVGIKKFAYDIWGDTVNLAARMESNGEIGKVNISASTYELVKNNFQCAYRGKLEAKNKGMIDMYFAENN